MAIGAFGVLTIRPSGTPAPAPAASQGGAGGADVGNPVAFSARGAIVRAPSVVTQTASQLVASSMPSFLPGSQAGAAFGGGASPTPANTPTSTGPTVVVAATPSTVVPGTTPAPGTAAPSVDASQASFDGGSVSPPPAPAGVQAAASSAPTAVSATAPSSATPAKASGLTMTEGLAIGAAALTVVGFVLLRKGGKKRRR